MIHGFLNDAEKQHHAFDRFARQVIVKAKKDRLGKPPNRSMSPKEKKPSEHYDRRADFDP